MNGQLISTARVNTLHEFEGRPIPSVVWRGQRWWPARQVGRALEQGDDGKQFVRNVVESDCAIEGKDYVRVSGHELVEFQGILDGGNCPPSRNPQRGAREMVLLSETGLDIGLFMSRTELGKRMRSWMFHEVLPALRATGTYTMPNATAAHPTYLPATPTLEKVLAHHYVFGPAYAVAGEIARRTGESVGRVNARILQKLRNRLQYNGAGASWANWANDPNEIARLCQHRDAVFEAERAIARRLPKPARQQWEQTVFVFALTIVQRKPN